MNCRHCEELIGPDEQSPMMEGFHRECAARLVIGSVGHVLELCSCHGGSLSEPPALSIRAAAWLAFRLQQIKHDPAEFLTPWDNLAIARLLFPAWREGLPPEARIRAERRARLESITNSPDYNAIPEDPPAGEGDAP